MARVLIDARNVLRSQWPNLPEQELVERVRDWAERNGHEVVLVFDGKAPGGIVGPQPLDGRTILVGSGAESADDWLIREAPGYPAAWLVTTALACASGRRLQDAHVFGGPLRVLYVSAEDSTNEMALRVRAAMKHHGLSDADVSGLHIIGADL